MNKSTMWRIILIVCATIGVIALLAVGGMHQRMMGGMNCC